MVKMNIIQNFIDRQLGFYYRFNYDNILQRLVVNSEESFYGLQNTTTEANFDQDPPIFACRFSEAPGYEHILALANEDGRVAIQDTSNINTASTLEGFQCHNNAVFDLAWMPGHRNFVTVSGDHTACLWDVAESTPKKILVFSSHTRSVKTAVFRPTEPTVFATGARDGHILIWDIRASNQPSVVFKPDNFLMNCHSCFTPKTPNSHAKRSRLDSHRAISITGLVFQDDMTLISCGECDGNIKVWDLRKNYNIYTREPLPKHSIPYCGSSTKNGYTNLVIDEARIRLYASCMDDVIYCFNVAAYGALPEQRYIGHENGTFYIKAGLSPDGAYLVSGSSDKSAYIWNVKYPQPVVRLAGHRAEVTCAAWRRGAPPALATCSDDARHMLWRVGRDRDLDRDIDIDRDRLELCGRAEPVPRAPPRAWPAERTPRSAKRRAGPAAPAPFARPKRPRADGAPEARRSLAALMAGSPAPGDESGGGAPSGPAKRHLDDSVSSPTKKRCCDEPSTSAEWGYLCPEPGSTCFMTPTKNYEKRSCRKLSPRSPKPISPKETLDRTPVRVSPSKVRIVSFTLNSPTKNLPDFVRDGEAPHLRLMSPLRKKRDNPDWLTLMARERRRDTDKPPAMAPLSPKESLPTHRNSTSEKTPKSAKKARTLLNYFNVSVKEK